MKKKARLVLLTIFMLGLSLNLLDAQTLLTHYPLTSDLNDATGNFGAIALTGLTYTSDSLYSYGNYPDRATTPLISTFDETNFEIEVEFMLYSFTADDENPIIVGSFYYRWFGIVANTEGYLGTFCNNNSNYVYSDTQLELNQWYTVRCQYSGGRVILILDDVKIMDICYPTLVTGGSSYYKFVTGHGNGEVLNGAIRNLKVYNDPVVPEGTGGSIDGDGSICFGESTGTLTLSGYSGDVQFWEKSLDEGSWTTISNTSATYSETPSSAGLWMYRAASGCGTPVYSDTATISVSVETVGGSVSGKTPEIYGTVDTLTLSGHLGTVVKWQKMEESGSWEDIAATDTFLHEITASAATWYYRAQVQNGACPAMNADSVTLEIQAKDLTVTGATANDKAYDGTDIAMVSGAALDGIVGSDIVSLGDATTGVFSSISVGTGIPVTTDMYLMGEDSANYTLSQQPSSLAADITQRPLEITADEGQNKDVGGPDPVFTYSITSGSLVGSDALSGELSRESGETPGNYAILIGSLSAGGNYDISFVSADFVINSSTSVTAGVSDIQQYVYPNPTMGKVFINASIKGELKVLNLQGKLILTKTISKEDNTIDLSDQLPGIYLLIISNNDVLYKYRIVKM